MIFQNSKPPTQTTSPQHTDLKEITLLLSNYLGLLTIHCINRQKPYQKKNAERERELIEAGCEQDAMPVVDVTKDDSRGGTRAPRRAKWSAWETPGGQWIAGVKRQEIDSRLKSVFRV